MTRADTLKEIADHYYALADLFTQLAGDSASASVSAARPAPVQSPPAGAGQFDSADYDELPASEFADALPARQQEAVLSECPVHFKPWTVKEGGISKNGKPYSAFWKCNGKNQDGSYCSKKPTPAWVKSHPPENALVAA